MPIFLPPTVATHPNERLESWAVFEVTLPGLSGPTLHVVGHVDDGTGRVSSPLVNIDEAARSVVTRSSRVYRLVGRPGLGGSGEYVWNRWVAGWSARDVTDVTAEFALRFNKPRGDSHGPERAS